MFCSEIMAHYYEYCISGQYQKITGHEFDNNLRTLFGPESPQLHEMFKPGDYSVEHTPHAPIFKNKDENGEQVIHIVHADLWYIILQPLLIILFVMLIIWMLLPR